MAVLRWIRAKDNLVADLVTVKPHVHELSALSEEASFGEQKAFLRSFVKSIDVWPEKVLVRYTLPIPSNGTRQETIHSLSTMLNGTPGGYICRVPYLPITPHKVATLA